jgi:hypothetical protein
MAPININHLHELSKRSTSTAKTVFIFIAVIIIIPTIGYGLLYLAGLFFGFALTATPKLIKAGVQSTIKGCKRAAEKFRIWKTVKKEEKKREVAGKTGVQLEKICDVVDGAFETREFTVMETQMDDREDDTLKPLRKDTSMESLNRSWPHRYPFNE